MKDYCIHEWKEESNYEVCINCGVKHLILNNTEHFDLKVGIKSNGYKYTVRDNRKRYFFPEEWNDFYNSLNKKQQPLFYTLLITGARIEEALHIKVEHFKRDYDFVTLYVTKIKAKKKQTKSEPRDITLSKAYRRFIKKYIEDNNLQSNDFLFMNKDKNIDKQVNSISVTLRELLKRHLKILGVIDYYNFSLHNIRKTHGMWLKALGIAEGEICQRLGHDANTFRKHYGSCDIFKSNHLTQMKSILGGIYGL